MLTTLITKFLTAIVSVHTWIVSSVRPPSVRRSAGQSTAEYALVLLGAAAIALVFLAWATKTGRINKLFDTVLDSVTGKVA